MKHAMLLSMLAMMLAANAGAQTSPKQLPETANIRGLLLSAIDSKNGTATTVSGLRDSSARVSASRVATTR